MPPPTTLGPGARLRAAREVAGLTRRELAEQLGMNYGSLKDIEADRHNVRSDTIHRIAVAIGCDPHSIDPRLASTRPVTRAARRPVS
jgi:transcriptional regulator with XRE-family HTH domain